VRIGFAVTCYDKFEEAKILFEILRNEFEGDYPISFCSNHPDGRKFAEEQDVDVFTEGRDIPFVKPEYEVMYADPRWKSNLRNHTVLRVRAADSVQRSCQGALKLDVDYVIHMHSDAWVLDEDRLRLFIDDLDSRGKKLAVRGDGLERVDYARTPSSACGHLDDHFFAFNRRFFIEKNVFDFVPEELFPHKYSVHGMLMMIFVTRVGLRNIWYYRFINDLLCYDNKKFLVKNVKPSIFDDMYRFVHIHRNSFPGDYGKRIQAMYLKNEGFGRSRFVRDFIDRYYDPDCVGYLVDMEKKLDRKLRMRMFPRDKILKREITVKKNLLDNFGMGVFLSNLVHPLKDYALKRFFPVSDSIPGLYDNVIKLDNEWAGDIYS